VQAFAQSIVETVRYPLAVLDLHLKFVASNAPFRDTFGIIAEGSEARRPVDVDSAILNIPGLRSLLEERVGNHEGNEGHRNEKIDVDYDSPHLGRRSLVFNARRVVRDGDGAPMILLSVEDETEKRKTWDELRRMNEELEGRVARRTADLETANRELLDANRELTATNRELEAFCYSVSHDLRSPLRAVDGFSQELLDSYSGNLDEQGRHYLERVRSGTQRMGQLIDDLLQLSRLTRSDMEKVRVDLSSLIERLVAEFRQREPERGVTFRIQPGLTAVCDPRLIRVALENLFENACKFTNRKSEALIEFGGSEDEAQSTFFIRDNGAGFDPAFAGKLFGAFQRLHSDRDFPGTGIGLATVQRIIRRHGGDTWAEGAVGQGATFFFTLPRSDKQI
jgi:signal transduction histidine kinase